MRGKTDRVLRPTQARMRSQARERREAGGGAGRKSPDAAEPGPGSCGREFTDQKNAAFGFKSSWCFSVEELGMQPGLNSRQRSNPPRFWSALMHGYFQKLNQGIPLQKVTTSSALFPPKITQTGSREPHGLFIFHFLFQRGRFFSQLKGFFLQNRLFWGEGWQ